jgi:hypothetical protein
MAGSRPSQFKKGGGRLNGVDGTIAGYEWTTEYPFQSEDRPAKRTSEFNSLYFVLRARLDGADEDTIEPIWAGNADNFEIEDGGLTLTPVEDTFELGANTDFGKFIGSLCEAGFPDTNLPEDRINYEAIVGTRVRFGQVQTLDKTGKPRKRVVNKGKFKGREFDVTSTVVTNVLDLPSVRGKANGAAKTVKAATKPNGRVAAPVEDDETAELAGATIASILSKNVDKQGNSMPLLKTRFQMRVFAELGAKHPQNNEVVAWLKNDKNLEGLENVSVTYNQAGEVQAVSLA